MTLDRVVQEGWEELAVVTVDRVVQEGWEELAVVSVVTAVEGTVCRELPVGRNLRSLSQDHKQQRRSPHHHLDTRHWK